MAEGKVQNAKKDIHRSPVIILVVLKMADEEEENEGLEDIINLFESQLMEIEVIQSIFSGEGELEITNKETIDDIATICEKYRSHFDVDRSHDERRRNIFKQISYLRCISLDVRLDIGERLSDVVNVSITLPIRYPQDPPEVFLSSNGLTRERQGVWNAEMLEYLKEIANGEQIIYNLLQWLKDTGEKHFHQLRGTDANEKESITDCKHDKKAATVCSIWLYMHHIYNKNKRRDIINWANELQLTGFSLPGKPGVVHVEGDAENVDEYFMRLRRLPWKRISCVHRETFDEASKHIRTFQTFEELCFDAHGSRDYHMDMGKFNLFLKEHKLEHMFVILFGIKK